MGTHLAFPGPRESLRNRPYGQQAYSELSPFPAEVSSALLVHREKVAKKKLSKV